MRAMLIMHRGGWPPPQRTGSPPELVGCALYRLYQGPATTSIPREE